MAVLDRRDGATYIEKMYDRNIEQAHQEVRYLESNRHRHIHNLIEGWVDDGNLKWASIWLKPVAEGDHVLMISAPIKI
jgi:hypothetical protein